MGGTFFKDDDFEFMMLMVLGATYHNGEHIGECLSVAASIDEGGYEGWYRSWLARFQVDDSRGSRPLLIKDQ